MLKINLISLEYLNQPMKFSACSLIFSFSRTKDSSFIDIAKNMILIYLPNSGWLVGLVGFYCISTIVGYLMPNPFLYIYIKYIKFGLVEFYGILPIVGFLISNPLYTYILNI